MPCLGSSYEFLISKRHGGFQSLGKIEDASAHPFLRLVSLNISESFGRSAPDVAAGFLRSQPARANSAISVYRYRQVLGVILIGRRRPCFVRRHKVIRLTLNC
jgi:hypothetical protein